MESKSRSREKVQNLRVTGKERSTKEKSHEPRKGRFWEDPIPGDIKKK